MRNFLRFENMKASSLFGLLLEGFFSRLFVKRVFDFRLQVKSFSIVGEPVSSAVHTNEHPLLMHHVYFI